MSQTYNFHQVEYSFIKFLDAALRPVGGSEASEAIFLTDDELYAALLSEYINRNYKVHSDGRECRYEPLNEE